MKFTQRLAYYLFGILIGCMFLVYFFGEKKTEFCYLPNCRVLKDLRSKPVVYSPEAENIFKEGWVTDDDVRNTLTYGKVDFSKSNIEEESGKLYIVKGKNEAKEPIIVEIINYSDKVRLKNIKKGE
ncbi:MULTISPECIES: DUF4258 domain-containing protein [Myroides]|uniref:DUF4258 domain-containing protein n=1 Tax=Myroides albus TaxID=2562892 RepID=A0A6I3LHR3_9FLAO|nr:MULTISPECIES: DUF4258 domain-containing protein [Myroides]MTG97783.1 DUF4258 domain-containing protein [Myroides albus]MVX35533.1 DUF4258 domain-containing protein [Myroides sp. LoEW2-1]UVD79739.1 DUF4258 domain-containing protein [Myroides albus]